MPINLSIENNFKAFAKIIQSFSKAKSLNVSNSKSLKKFLLEDKGKRYQELFNKYKAQLKDLLKEHRDIIAYINDLEQKQKSLLALKQKEDNQSETYKKYLENKLRFAFQEKKELERKFNELKQELEKKESEQKVLQDRNIRLGKIIDKANEVLEQEKKISEALTKYKTIYLNLQDNQSKIKQLADLEVPKILEVITQNLDINQYKNQ